MPKIITVTDGTGRVYQPTYPRRAKGLAKRGRAIFVDENTICLVSPPHEAEDNTMTIQDIFQRVNELAEDQQHIFKALDALVKLEKEAPLPQNSVVPDVAGQARAEALADIVKSAETTRQQLLAFYVTLYNDLKGTHPNA